MSIQVTLNANEFKKDGVIKGLTFNNGKYDSLKIIRFGNGRVYFMAMSKEVGGKVGSFAKQMQLIDGTVVISFGKNDKLVIGTYVDTNVIVETPATEAVSEQMETVQEEVKEEVSAPETTANATQSPIKLKVSKDKQSILIRGYMGKVEHVEGQKIQYDHMSLYLVNHSKYWAVYEELTGCTVTKIQHTKKEMLSELETLLTEHSEAIINVRNSRIEKDGYISSYKVGSWIRSA